MRRQIVDQLTRGGGATPEQAARARACANRRGNLVEDLIAIGFTPGAVLDACVQVTGIPPAPASWLKDPRPPAKHIDAALCRKLGAAPVASTGGRLCIAFGNPETAMQSEALGLPPHQPYLALPSQLAKALSLLPQVDEDDAPATEEPELTRTDAAAAAPDLGDDAPGDDLEGVKTVIADTSAMRELIEEQERLRHAPVDDDDDGAFAEAKTVAVASMLPPPAPTRGAPARHREAFAAPPPTSADAPGRPSISGGIAIDIESGDDDGMHDETEDVDVGDVVAQVTSKRPAFQLTPDGGVPMPRTTAAARPGKRESDESSSPSGKRPRARPGEQPAKAPAPSPAREGKASPMPSAPPPATVSMKGKQKTPSKPSARQPSVDDGDAGAIISDEQLNTGDAHRGPARTDPAYDETVVRPPSASASASSPSSPVPQLEIPVVPVDSADAAAPWASFAPPSSGMIEASAPHVKSSSSSSSSSSGPAPAASRASAAAEPDSPLVSGAGGPPVNAPRDSESSASVRRKRGGLQVSSAAEASAAIKPSALDLELEAAAQAAGRAVSARGGDELDGSASSNRPSMRPSMEVSTSAPRRQPVTERAAPGPSGAAAFPAGSPGSPGGAVGGPVPYEPLDPFVPAPNAIGSGAGGRRETSFPSKRPGSGSAGADALSFDAVPVTPSAGGGGAMKLLIGVVVVAVVVVGVVVATRDKRAGADASGTGGGAVAAVNGAGGTGSGTDGAGGPGAPPATTAATAAPAEIPMDGKVSDLAASQQELIEAGKAEQQDHAKAIALFGQAIALSPGAPASRDALLERARRYLATMELEKAEGDLMRLRRRNDVEPIDETIEQMLEDLQAARAQMKP